MSEELSFDGNRELAKQKQKLLNAKIDAFIGDSDDDLALLFSFLIRLKVKRDKEVNGHSNAQFVALCRECVLAANNIKEL
ncbi:MULTISPECIES: hypothetical protein [unclassified Pseudoalteromonas]|uniref:hypothetical protein n=1 Tax=unclassified Pseudoalteromonas TaxID=194690 RepID=UPI00041069CE|nr:MULTISPECIES: hypothetical protein [unclassified Pseudoalteromonas]